MTEIASKAECDKAFDELVEALRIRGTFKAYSEPRGRRVRQHGTSDYPYFF